MRVLARKCRPAPTPDARCYWRKSVFQGGPSCAGHPPLVLSAPASLQDVQGPGLRAKSSRTGCHAWVHTCTYTRGSVGLGEGLVRYCQRLTLTRSVRIPSGNQGLPSEIARVPFDLVIPFPPPGPGTPDCVEMVAFDGEGGEEPVLFQRRLRRVRELSGGRVSEWKEPRRA